jgi:hypothetical protein
VIAETYVCSYKYYYEDYVLATIVFSDDSDFEDYLLDGWIDLTDFWDD